MGLFSGIASFCSGVIDKVSSFFSGRGSSSRTGSNYSLPSMPFEISKSTSHSTTTYDPDRVKAAQIEADSKIKLAGMEKERLEYIKQAQLDIIEAQTQSRIAQERAKAEGFTMISEAIVMMQDKLNEIAERRIAIIERGTLQAVREAESFYAELTAEIKAENDRNTAEKLPALLEILGRYEPGSSAHNLYVRKIDEDISLQAKHTANQLGSVIKRQERMIDEIMTAKGKITEQTSEITKGMLEALKRKVEEIDTGFVSLPEVKEVAALPC